VTRLLDQSSQRLARGQNRSRQTEYAHLAVRFWYHLVFISIQVSRRSAAAVCSLAACGGTRAPSWRLRCPALCWRRALVVLASRAAVGRRTLPITAVLGGMPLIAKLQSPGENPENTPNGRQIIRIYPDFAPV
jgi:hypothetical protein